MLLLLYIVALLPCKAQAIIVPQERICIQTDKPYYAPGDTVWLRAHLMDADTNIPVSRSHFVYVELYNQQADTLMQRMIIRSDEKGVFANRLLLPKTMQGGVYTLVAYTQWTSHRAWHRVTLKEAGK